MGSYEILDATALGRRLGFKRDTILAYISQTLALSSQKVLPSSHQCLGRTAFQVPPESLTVIRWRYAYYPLEVQAEGRTGTETALLRDPVHWGFRGL
jgi:hypothetical protein